MKKKSKRYRESIKNIDKEKLYNATEGFDLLYSIAKDEKSKLKFNETVEIAFNLNLKAKHGGTALTFAAENGNKETALLLKKAGAR